MKEVYEEPYVEIITFDTEDIITTSPIIEDDDGNWSGWYQ